jgi:hypothetical protein
MFARDTDVTWKEVTDRGAMARVLNSGETFYRLSARNPDVRALINLFFDRVGDPAESGATRRAGDA